MTPPVVPSTYDEWRHCITVLCRIPLTIDFVDARIAALADRTEHGTQRFAETWGEAHLSRVMSWFVRARDELQKGAVL